MLADLIDGHELLHRCLQHMAQAAEFVQQVVGDGVGVLPGEGVEQQKLQGMELLEMVEPLVEKAFFDALSVLGMDRRSV